MEKIQKIRDAQRSVGPACIMGIGKAVPENFFTQKEYAQYYFRVTNSEDKVALKEKFQRICEKTQIKKRHFLLTEEMLKKNPGMLTYGAPSHDGRRELAVELIPKLGAKAAESALKDWGHPKSKITHLIVYTTLALTMPGTDFEIATLLGLDTSVHRTVHYLIGCNGGVHVLRHAKDIVENNKGARVLVVCCESTIVNFHGPSEDQIECLIGQALFSDGAAAVVVGSDPDLSIERPLFQLVYGTQTTVPDTTGVACEILEMGQTVRLRRDLPYFVSKNVVSSLKSTFEPLGIDNWNSLFWVCHNGGKIVLDQTEVECKLEKDKLEASRYVLNEYGNMSSSAVFFILDETRKRSLEQGKSTTGLGLDWGVMFGFGPGLTVETLVLHSMPLEV